MTFVRLILLALLLNATNIMAESVSIDDEVVPVLPKVKVTMRDNGYTMGDFIHMQVEFSIPENQTLDEESLPLVGRVKPWMDLRELSLDQVAESQHSQRITLNLTWQIFATVEFAQQLKTPEITLKTLGKTPQKIIISGHNFYYSPIFSLPLQEVKRRANLPPPTFDTQTPLKYLSVCLLLMALCALAWFWLKDLIPCLPHRPGPMTQLARKMRKQSSFALSLGYLRDIHTALNQSAGMSLYPGNLNDLFKRAPYLNAEKTAITQFFNRSWDAFYHAENPAMPDINTAETSAWIKRVALLERLFRRQNFDVKIKVTKIKNQQSQKLKK